MTTRQLSFQSPPQVAVAANATTPALGATEKGALGWSTVTQGLVYWQGTSWKTLGAPAPTLLTIDLGPVPTLEYLVDVNDPVVGVSNVISAQVVGLGAGRDLDELEMDFPTIDAWVTAAGMIRMHVRGEEGPVHDTYRIAYTIL